MDPRFQMLEVEGPEGLLPLAFTEWGREDAAQVVVCVHGLTRNARDFDALAERLANDARVLAIDVPGRGRSGWFEDKSHYDVPVYAALMKRFLAAQGLRAVDWIGTSMGGLIGMHVGAEPDSPIARLVLNDIGPAVPKDALQMIRDYLGLQLDFASLDELEQHLRLIHAPFGPLSDAEWRHLATHSSRQREDGRWILSYDPGIREPFVRAAEEGLDEWQVYDRIRCPTLVLRGRESVILTQPVLEAMQARGPRPEVIEFDGIGHAPALMSADQIEAILGWLRRHRTS